MSKELFAVFGNPIGHSKSPLLHNALFRELCIDACYTRYLLEDGEALKSRFFSLGLSGANVTVPFKENAFEACDERDYYAQNIGAVNTIKLKEGKLYGYNTDAPGFMASLDGFRPKSALLLGAGGTARAIAYALRAEGIEPIVANRGEARLSFFKERGFCSVTFANLKSFDFELVINSTSAGLESDSLPCDKELLHSALGGAKLAYDCIYKETPFLKEAHSCRVETKSGLDMLIWQAFFAFEIFSGKKLDQKMVEVMKYAAY